MKEYKVIRSSTRAAEERMNAMAKLGWELHSVTYCQAIANELILTFWKEV